MQYLHVDGWNASSNAYDSPGTYPDYTPAEDGVVVVVPWTGEGWTNTLYRWRSGVGYDDPLGKTKPAAKVPYESWAYDSQRGQLFNLSYGDGRGYSLSLGRTAMVVRRGGPTPTAGTITFQPSAGLTQLDLDVPANAGMTYDPIHDRFYFYAGSGSGHMYEIAPSSGTVWSIALFAYPKGSATPPKVASSGLHTRFTYLPALRGIAMLPSSAAGVYFLRLAP